MAQRTIFPPICIALGLPDVDTLLAHAHAEYVAGERFLEFRLDYLTDPLKGITAIKKFLARHPDCTILATCRRRQNQGKFTGSIEEQLKVLNAALEGGAHAIDLEIESAENCEEKLADLRASTYLLLSYHNYGGTPPRLDNVLRRMTQIPAHGYKIVTTARKPSDTSRVLALAKMFPKVPTILLAMGETGFATRVLSPSMGGLYTYAAPNMAVGTASGQVNAKKLRSLYRVGKISRDARIYGVIADPVSHSISPAVHNRAFQAKRIDATYLPFLVHPGQLKDFFAMAEDLPLAGFSVTIPHKQKILRYLDQVDIVAKRIGAVNTVWRKAGKWRGTNTDAPGVTVPLEQHLRLNKSSVLVVGNAERPVERPSRWPKPVPSFPSPDATSTAFAPSLPPVEPSLYRAIKPRPGASTPACMPPRSAWLPTSTSVFSRTKFRPSLSWTWCMRPWKPSFSNALARSAPSSSPALKCSSNRPRASSKYGPASAPRAPSWNRPRSKP